MLEKFREDVNCDYNGFKIKDWLEIVRNLNQQAKCVNGKQHLQSQYSILKKYFVFKKRVDNFGFGWDEEKKIAATPPEVWEV